MFFVFSRMQARRVIVEENKTDLCFPISIARICLSNLIKYDRSKKDPRLAPSHHEFNSAFTQAGFLGSVRFA